YGGANGLPNVFGRKKFLVLRHLLREFLNCLHAVRANGMSCHVVGARGTSESQVYAVWIQMPECSELFGYDKGSVIGKHDATGTHADTFGTAGHMTNENRGSHAGDTHRIVVFGKPETRVAEFLGLLREIYGLV